MGLINTVNLTKQQDISDNISNKTEFNLVEQDIDKEKPVHKKTKSENKKNKEKEVGIQVSVQNKREIDDFFNRIKANSLDVEEVDSNTISLFSYDKIPGKYNPLALFNFAYSCMRFEILRNMKPIKDDKYFFKNLFNYRIYFTKHFKFVAETLLLKRFRSLMKSGELFYIENTFPVIYYNNHIIFCIDSLDDLYTEYIIKMYIEGVIYSHENKTLIRNKINKVESYQTITLKNYQENEVSSKKYFDLSIEESLFKIMISNFNGKTKAYDPNFELCDGCPYKVYCEKYRNPLSFSI